VKNLPAPALIALSVTLSALVFGQSSQTSMPTALQGSWKNYAGPASGTTEVRDLVFNAGTFTGTGWFEFWVRNPSAARCNRLGTPVNGTYTYGANLALETITLIFPPIREGTCEELRLELRFDVGENAFVAHTGSSKVVYRTK
jgi:hypothetical protein